jgi:hypothetical protein
MKAQEHTVTVAHASRLLECSESTVRRYIKQGLLPATKQQGQLQVSKKDLLSLQLRLNPGSYSDLNTTYFIEDDNHRRDKLCYILRQDADSLMERLEIRLIQLCKLWSQERKRVPFLQTLRTKYFELPVAYLLNLSRPELEVLQQFYDELDRLLWYLEYTQDMPSTLERHLIKSFKNLQRYHQQMKETIVIATSRTIIGNQPEVEAEPEPERPNVEQEESGHASRDPAGETSQG